jgi:hypothetical protein
MSILFYSAPGGPQFPPEVPWVETFDGENGSPPNPLYWEISGTGGSVVINDNKARVTDSASGNKYLDTLFNITGDFEVYVDYTMSGYSGLEGWGPALEIQLDTTNKILLYEEGWAGTSHNIKMSSWVGGSRVNISGVLNGLYASLRVVRSGSVWSGYYNTGTGWVLLGSRTIGSGTVTRVSLQTMNWTNYPVTYTDFDNFTIAQGTLIAP